MGRQHQGMDMPGVRQVQEGSGEQRKMEETGCKITSGAPTTLAVKELMMTMMGRRGKHSSFIFFFGLECRETLRRGGGRWEGMETFGSLWFR